MEDFKNEMEAISEYFEDDIADDNDSFENYRKNITTIVAFLIGVPEEKFTGEDRFDIEEYEKLKNSLIVKYQKLYNQVIEATTIEEINEYFEAAEYNYKQIIDTLPHLELTEEEYTFCSTVISAQRSLIKKLTNAQGA